MGILQHSDHYNIEFYILILFVAQLFYFLLVEIAFPAGRSGQPDIRQTEPYIRLDTGSRKRPDIRRAGYLV